MNNVLSKMKKDIWNTSSPQSSSCRPRRRDGPEMESSSAHSPNRHHAHHHQRTQHRRYPKPQALAKANSTQQQPQQSETQNQEGQAETQRHRFQQKQRTQKNLEAAKTPTQQQNNSSMNHQLLSGALAHLTLQQTDTNNREENAGASESSSKRSEDSKQKHNDLERMSAVFFCFNCKTKWHSTHVYVKMGQKKPEYGQICKTCNTEVIPKRVYKPKCQTCGQKDCDCETKTKPFLDPKQTHRRDLCAKCLAGDICA